MAWAQDDVEDDVEDDYPIVCHRRLCFVCVPHFQIWMKKNPQEPSVLELVGYWMSLRCGSRYDPAKTSASSLDLTGQGITCLVRQVLAINTESRLALLRELDCTANQILRLDPVVCRSLRSIQVLSLGANQLRALPSEISYMCTLRELRLESNGLSTLPWQIGELVLLEALWLGCNELTVLPDSIGGLRKLRELWLVSNSIESLPQSVGDLFRLERLELSSNLLTSLPPSITRLARLKELHLRGNQLSVLPLCLSPGPTCLEVLDLSHNNLEYIPPGATHSHPTALRLIPPHYPECHPIPTSSPQPNPIRPHPTNIKFDPILPHPTRPTQPPPHPIATALAASPMLRVLRLERNMRLRFPDRATVALGAEVVLGCLRAALKPPSPPVTPRAAPAAPPPTRDLSAIRIPPLVISVRSLPASDPQAHTHAHTHTRACERTHTHTHALSLTHTHMAGFGCVTVWGRHRGLTVLITLQHRLGAVLSSTTQAPLPRAGGRNRLGALCRRRRLAATRTTQVLPQLTRR